MGPTKIPLDIFTPILFWSTDFFGDDQKNIVSSSVLQIRRANGSKLLLLMNIQETIRENFIFTGWTSFMTKETKRFQDYCQQTFEAN